MFVTSSALALGFLHGLGADHLMAIAVLATGESALDAGTRRARTFRVALGFAAGHALLLLCGSALVILTGWTIPSLVERTGEMVGGCILIGLGLAGVWVAVTERVYGHRHPHGRPPRSGWHLHVGTRARHPLPHRHSAFPTLLGGVFAVSGLRALVMLGPIGTGSGDWPLLTVIGLVLVFAVGVLLSMSLFGIVLARSLGRVRVEATGRAAAAFTAVASVVLGTYWVFW